MLIIKLKNFIYFYIFRFFEFLVFDKISYKWLKFSRKTNLRFYKNEDQLNNFNHNIYAEKFTHPFINLKYLQKLSELNPDLAYQKLPEYDKIKKNWINTNMKYFDSNLTLTPLMYNRIRRFKRVDFKNKIYKIVSNIIRPSPLGPGLI